MRAWLHLNDKVWLRLKRLQPDARWYWHHHSCTAKGPTALSIVPGSQIRCAVWLLPCRGLCLGGCCTATTALTRGNILAAASAGWGKLSSVTWQRWILPPAHEAVAYPRLHICLGCERMPRVYDSWKRESIWVREASRSLGSKHKSPCSFSADTQPLPCSSDPTRT